MENQKQAVIKLVASHRSQRRSAGEHGSGTGEVLPVEENRFRRKAPAARVHTEWPRSKIRSTVCPGGMSKGSKRDRQFWSKYGSHFSTSINGFSN